VPKLNPRASRAAPQTRDVRTRAKEEKLIVCIEVRLPAVSIVRQPNLAALGALGDEGDFVWRSFARVYAARFGAHRRRQGKGMLAESEVLRRTATLQAAYFLVTGLWPIASRPTFEAVTGPKTDYWLIRTVGALASVIGTTLGVAAYRNRVSSELTVLGIGSALAFGAVDVFYATTGRISRVYLVDAAVECVIAGGWASALLVSE
jgi:hypothetical protein